MYLERGKGCYVWDVDGHRYIDFIMAFGPVLLGYADEEVDRAAVEELAQGALLSLNRPMHVAFVETLLEWFPRMDQAIFFRTGSEATTAALRIARRATGRRRVARAGYHGWHDWCLPEEDFVPSGLSEQVVEFAPNDPESLVAVFARYPGEIAAVILAPEMVLPLRKVALESVARQCHEQGALFILDEVKTGFRAPRGSVQEYLSLDPAPDLTTVSKALGNGWPIAAVLGRRSTMAAASGMHLSATFHGETAAMAAALATMRLLKARNVAHHVERRGARLIEGLSALVNELGVRAEAYGEPLPCMPFLRFVDPDEDRNQRVRGRFYEEMIKRGILLHPRHLWFVSAAHTDEDMAQTLKAARESFAVALANSES